MTYKSFTAEEVRDAARTIIPLRVRAMLTAYADMLERPTNSGEPITLADFVTLPDAECVQIGQQVAARVDAMMDRSVAQATTCTEERPCTPCFTDNGQCEDPKANWQVTPPESPDAADSGRVTEAREMLAREFERGHPATHYLQYARIARESQDVQTMAAIRAISVALAAQGQCDAQTWDENAERLTREAGIGGGRINPNATSMDDVFLPTSEPASPNGVPHQVRFAIERCLRSQEKLADRIEKANPGDPYAALMIREDIEVIRQYLSTLSSEVGHCQCAACMVTHASDCAVHNMPAMPNGPCDCGAISPAGVPDGWVLMPRELPERIRTVLVDRFALAVGGEVMLFTDIWSDLIAAAPPAPARHCDRGPDDCVQCSVLARTFAVKSAAPSAPEGDGGCGVSPLCPTCRNPLKEVRYNSDSMLNRDQWESTIAGNWYCTTCPDNGRGSSGYAYFWDREVTTKQPTQPTGE